MVKLSAELIQQSPQFVNAIRDRQLDLRGHGIPLIENLGATLDQFDTIDFSDNDIHKVDGFPLLRRLKCVLLNNNRVVRLGENLEASLPNIESLILTNNRIRELGDLDPLATVKSLRTISLLNNPVTDNKHYRAYLAYKLPHLLMLDFKKIKPKERDAAVQLFKSKKGKQLESEIAKKSKTFTPGAGLPDAGKTQGPSPAEIQAIKELIAKANSLDEIEQLNQMLKSGHIPKEIQSNSMAQPPPPLKNGAATAMEVDPTED